MINEEKIQKLYDDVKRAISCADDESIQEIIDNKGNGEAMDLLMRTVEPCGFGQDAVKSVICGQLGITILNRNLKR